jgi:glycolate oxidase FAD binding subunit
VATAVDRPGSIAALGETIRTRAAEGLAVYPQGGRTCLDHGGTPARPGVALDTTPLTRVVDYPAADMTITVEAGMTLATLQQTLAAHDQWLPLDPPRADLATLGGIYATAACGPRRFGWGRPRDQVIGLSFVAADGRVVKGGGRVVKNVAGYDFPKLLTGSLGTLGVIAQLTLKVRPRPGSTAVAWVPLPDLPRAARELERLGTSGTRPVAIELLNRATATRLGAPLGLTTAGWVLALGFDDNADAVAWQVAQLQREIPDVAVESRVDAAAAPLWGALAENPARDDTAIALQANLRPSKVAAFLARLDPGRWAVQAHAGSGIVRAHLEAPGDLARLGAELTSLRAEAQAAEGNLILTRCPAERKAELGVWGTPRPDWRIMEQLKQALDPEAVLNPGRFVGKI